jgi:hypothetical protein
MEREYIDPLTGEANPIEPKFSDLSEEYETEVAKQMIKQSEEPQKKKSQRQRLEQKLPPAGYAYRAPLKKHEYVLKEYWFVKGEYSYLKASPVHAIDSARIVEYLWNGTSLFHYEFWAKLSYEKQKSLCSYFNMKEEVHSKIVFNDKVFIVLNGTCRVQVLDEFAGFVDRTYHIGDVFGCFELFGFSLKESHEYPTKLLLNHTIHVERATLICLSIKDYVKIACIHDDTNYSLVNQYVKMSFAERKIYEVTGILRKSRISKLFQTFLESNKLLSDDPSAPSYSYISEEAHGALTEVRSDTIYVILEGSMRILLEKRGGGLMACEDDGESTITIKRNSMPLVILEAGSILFIGENFIEFNENKQPNYKNSSTLSESKDGGGTYIVNTCFAVFDMFSLLTCIHLVVYRCIGQ